MYCPTLFSRNYDYAGPEQINFLANRIRAIRKQTRAMVEAMQVELQAADSALPVDLQHIAATEKIRLSGEDMAQDCFHLSPVGQAKLADQLP